MRKLTNIGCGAALAIMVVAVVILGFQSLSNPPVSRARSVYRGPTESVACLIAEKFVTQQLKAPSTAEFASDCSVSKHQEIWTVRAYVDAQNGFGAMLRTDYVVEMTHNAKTDKWKLVDIAMIER